MRLFISTLGIGALSLALPALATPSPAQAAAPQVIQADWNGYGYHRHWHHYWHHEYPGGYYHHWHHHWHHPPYGYYAPPPSYGYRY